MAKGNPQRVILKLTGELFGQKESISFEQYDLVAKLIQEIVQKSNVQMAIVVGGGNIFRGREANAEVDASEADSMGMLATMMNGIGLREALVRNGAKDTRLMTAISIPELAEPYIRPKARHHLDNHRLVIISGGLGLPGFSTDSAVAQYASELKCEIIFKASTVDGVYNTDPKKDSNAVRYKTITYIDALKQGLNVMDQTAFAMCAKSKIPIFVFNTKNLHRLPEIVAGDYSFRTLIHE